MANIFRQAKELLENKDPGTELTEEERHTISAAEIPMNVRGCLPQDIAICELLEKMARQVEEANGETVAGSRVGQTAKSPAP